MKKFNLLIKILVFATLFPSFSYADDDWEDDDDDNQPQANYYYPAPPVYSYDDYPQSQARYYVQSPQIDYYPLPTQYYGYGRAYGYPGYQRFYRDCDDD